MNEQEHAWIVSDPAHLDGEPRIAGTRISIEFLLEAFACGMTLADILREYPTLTEEAIKGTLRELARRAGSRAA